MTRYLLLFAAIAVVLLAAAPSAMATLTFISGTDLGVPQAGFGTQAQSPDGHYVYLTSLLEDEEPLVYKVDLSGTTPTTVASVQFPRPGWCAIGSNLCGVAESAVVSPDGAFLYLGLTEGVAKLSTADLSTVAVWDKHTDYGSDQLTQAVVSPDGRYGYFADGSGVVLKLDLATMTPATSNGSPVVGRFDGIEGLLLSPDGQTIYGASNSPTSSVITKADTATLTPAATLSTGVPYIFNGVGSPDGRYGYFTDYALTGTQTTIVKVDLGTMTMVSPSRTFEAAHGTSIAISPDGSRLVTGNAANPLVAAEIDTSNALSVVGELVLSDVPSWPVLGPSLWINFISRDGRFVYFPTSNASGPPYPLVKVGLAPGHTLTVATAGTGTGTITSNVWGIDCGSSCSADYAATAGPITLTATPTAGSSLAGWSGACTGTGTCQVTLTTAKNATATFDPPTTFKTNSARVPAKAVAAGLHASAKGRIILPLACPAASSTGCSVSVNVNVTVPDALPRHGRASRLRTIAHVRNIKIAAGTTKRITLRLSPAFYPRLRTTRPRRITAKLRITTAFTGRATVTGTQRVPLWIAPVLRVPRVTG